MRGDIFGWIQPGKSEVPRGEVGDKPEGGRVYTRGALGVDMGWLRTRRPAGEQPTQKGFRSHAQVYKHTCTLQYTT